MAVPRRTLSDSFVIFLALGVCVFLSVWLRATASDPLPANMAYIGPGAGIALLGSFMAVLFAIFSALAAIMSWPIRWIWRTIRGRRALREAKVRRVVILGLDGLDPDLTEQFLDEGLLPNLEKLKQQGSYTRLATTWPPLSPVAWSSFSTGTNPGKHNIYDFISRNPTTYKPMVSSVRIRQPRRTLKIGKYVIPLARPEITGLRKSKPFWNVLGEANIFSAVLRVPITFPPDQFFGVQLAAMCVPDLLGSQGTFLYFSDHGPAGVTTESDVGGKRILVERRGTIIHSALEGPANSMRADAAEMRLPFTVQPNGHDTALLKINNQRIPLALNRFSDWIQVQFPMAPGLQLKGICRFYLKQFDERFEMYCTPIQIDPDNGSVSTGTGFFFAFKIDSERQIPLIVTNKHMVKGAKTCTFTLTKRADDGSPQMGSHEKIQLHNFESLWIGHPEDDVDLAVIPLAPLLRAAEQRGTKLFYISLNDSILPTTETYDSLGGIEDITMIGYPNGIWDEKNNMPIVRRGITATNPKLDWIGLPLFVIDCACFPGSSGSPVMIFNISGYTDAKGTTHIGKGRIILLGILFAGPQHVAEGEIQTIDIPLQQVPISLSKIPNNLGFVVKSQKLLDFKPILEKNV